MKKLISSGGVVFYKDKVILIKKERSWVFPKGKVKEGESLINAAKREIFEEVGIKTDEPLFYIDKIKYRYKDQNGILNEKEVNYYFFITENNSVQIEKTFLGYGWFYIDEAIKYLTYKNDKKILKKAIKIIKKEIKK